MENAPVSFLKRFKTLFLIVLGVLLIGGSASAAVILKHRKASQQQALITTAATSDPYHDFTGEIFDLIKTNYWEKLTDEQLSDLYRLGANKINSDTYTLTSNDRAGVLALVDSFLNGKTEDQRKTDTAKLSAIVMANLKPFNRSQILTKEVQQKLLDTVSNVDKTRDLYKDLGVAASASTEEIKKAYDSQPKTEERTYAYKVLTDDQSKTQYDKNGAQPTTYTKLLPGQVSYVKFAKVSPQSLDELAKAATELGNYTKSDSLIIDLRGNIGGVIDALQYFLGPFIGPNQYAYDFFHQGEPIPFKTKTTWLPQIQKYKKVVILTDGKVQSSAEVMTAAFKKYHVGVVVGTKTQGWGTIEHLTPIKNQIDDKIQYSALLVEDLTLREDQKPIEGNGVEPNIDITSKNWKQQLLGYYNNPELVSAVEKVWNTPPTLAN